MTATTQIKRWIRRQEREAAKARANNQNEKALSIELLINQAENTIKKFEGKKEEYKPRPLTTAEATKILAHHSENWPSKYK